MENFEQIKEALEEVGIPYINLISKNLNDDTFSGEYVDPKNPERNFTFDNARIISPNSIRSLISSKSIVINEENSPL
jgi:hypothetical protein